MSKNTKFEVNSPICNLFMQSWEKGGIVVVTGQAASGKTTVAIQALHLFFSKHYGEGYDSKNGLSDNAYTLAKLLNDYNQTMVLTHDPYSYRSLQMPYYLISQSETLEVIQNEIESKQIKNVIIEDYHFDSDDREIGASSRILRVFLEWLLAKGINVLVVAPSYRNQGDGISHLSSSLSMMANVIVSTNTLRDEAKIEVSIVKDRYSSQKLGSEFLNIKECFGN